MIKKVGVLGCGDVAREYLGSAKDYIGVQYVACASRTMESAHRRAEQFGIDAISVSEMMARDDIDIILNLTPPLVHAETTLLALSSGKHVYVEKPFASSLREARQIQDAADAVGLRVGVAPDTVLGAGCQTARRLIDEGAIGTPLLGTATMISHGMEHFHPAPESFYQPDVGPVMDIGPYYVSALVTLLGPVLSVSAIGSQWPAERFITAANSPRNGASFPAQVLTTIQAVLRFANGAQVSLTTSWDGWKSTLPSIELQGSDGAMVVPNVNWFGGTVQVATRRGEWIDTDTSASPLGRHNYNLSAGGTAANYRGVGLADMAAAIGTQRLHRANGAMAIHVLDVLQSIKDSANGKGDTIAISSTCERPDALSDEEAATLVRI